MNELHLHSASPRQLDSIINQNQIIQLPVRLPACPSVRLSACPPVRSSVYPSDYLEKKRTTTTTAAPLVFPRKLNIFRPQLGLTPPQSPYPFPVPFRSHSPIPVLVPFLLVTPAARLALWLHRMELSERQTDSPIKFIFAPSISIFGQHRIRFGNRDFGCAIVMFLSSSHLTTLSSPAETTQSYPAYIKL